MCNTTKQNDLPYITSAKKTSCQMKLQSQTNFFFRFINKINASFSLVSTIDIVA